MSSNVSKHSTHHAKKNPKINHHNTLKKTKKKKRESLSNYEITLEILLT